MKTDLNTSSALSSNIQRGLGSLCWWDLAGQVKPQDLRDILAAENVAIDVPDIDPVQAARRAVRSYSKGAGKADRYRAELVLVDENQPRRVVVGILRRAQVAREEVAWTQVDSFDFYDAGGSWAFSGGQTDEAREVQGLIQEAAIFLDHEWIRPNLITIPLRAMGALNLRRSGGIQYVAAVHDDALARVARVVRAIGSCEFHIVRLTDDAEGRAALGSTARKGLAEAVAEVVARLSAWESGEAKATERGIDGALADFAEARDLAQLYADSLNITLDDIQAAIASAEQRARAIVLGEDPRQQRITAPRVPKASQGVRRDGFAFGTVAAIHRMLAEVPVVDGVQTVGQKEMRAATLRSAAWTKAEKWAEGGHYRKHAMNAGYSVVSVATGQDGTLLVSLVSNGAPPTGEDMEEVSEEISADVQDTEPVVFDVAEAAIEADMAAHEAEQAEVIVQADPDPEAAPMPKLEAMPAVQLRQVYTQVLGEEPPPFRKGYGRKEMEREIRAALQ